MTLAFIFTGRIPSFISAITLSSIPALVAFIGGLLQWSDYFFGNTVWTNQRFDFIIVGGGSAGCAVAGRLSENPNFQILLLEAGGLPHPVGLVPLAVPFVQNVPATDWEYKTVPMNGTGLAFENQQLGWPRGKGLGGSSSTNFMIYMRGNPKDFDRWEELTGDPRWGYQNVEKYFRRIEDYHGLYQDNGFHSQGGPLRVEPASYVPGLAPFLSAVQESGYSIRDLNANQQEGFMQLEFTQKRGRRFSSYAAYIQPELLRRPNLKILRYAHVTKVHFDSQMRAVGVSFSHHGRPRYASATREIVISGGAVNTPQILMLSGIGPAEHLRSHGIQPLVNLPVGQNLQDHVTSIAGPFFLTQPASFLIDRDLTLKSISDYFLFGTGPLSAPFNIFATGVTSTSSAAPNWPNILYTLSSAGNYAQVGPLSDTLFSTRDSLLANHFRPFIGTDAHEVLISLGKPRSRGYIALQDANPFSKPLINPRYYTDPGNQDLEDMIEAFQQALKIYEGSVSLGVNYGANLRIPFAPCETHPFRSRQYIECFLRLMTTTLYHPAGTCPMGKAGDSSAVLDSQLRVIGTIGLRVADASVMPEITNANTNAPSMMIGEMCADLIKQSHWLP